MALLLMARRVLFETPKREFLANADVGREYDDEMVLRLVVAEGADAKVASERDAVDVMNFF